MHSKLGIISILGIFVLAPLSVRADDPFARNPFARTASAAREVQLVLAEALRLVPGKSSPIQIKFRVQEKLHINSNKPGSELLIPTQLTIAPAEGMKVLRVIYPAGHDYSFSFAPDEKLNVYTGEFTVTAHLQVPRNAKAGSHTLAGELQYQACNDNSCFPPRKLPVELPVTISAK